MLEASPNRKEPASPAQSDPRPNSDGAVDILSVRISPELKKRARVAAVQDDMTLQDLTRRALEMYLDAREIDEG